MNTRIDVCVYIYNIYSIFNVDDLPLSDVTAWTFRCQESKPLMSKLAVIYLYTKKTRIVKVQSTWGLLN